MGVAPYETRPSLTLVAGAMRKLTTYENSIAAATARMGKQYLNLVRASHPPAQAPPLPAARNAHKHAHTQSTS